MYKEIDIQRIRTGQHRNKTLGIGVIDGKLTQKKLKRGTIVTETILNNGSFA